MQDRSLADKLEELASAAPTPGGGWAAALAASAGAALVEMVVNLSVTKPEYADHVRPIGAKAGVLRHRAGELAKDDEAAFDVVMAAYRQPKATDDEKAARRAAIQAATVAAAQPPLRVAELATQVIDLAAELPGRSNPNVLSDVGVAASLAVAALESAAINVEVNLAALKDEDARKALAAELDGYLAAIPRGQRLVADVRSGILG